MMTKIKRALCQLIPAVMLMCLLCGCTAGAAQPAGPAAKSGETGILAYLTGGGSEDYTVTEDISLDLTGVNIACDKTLLVQAGMSLKLTGTLLPGGGIVTVRAEGAADGGGGKPVLDLSALVFGLADARETTLMEVRSDVELIAPREQERLSVDTSNGEWTSIKAAAPDVSSPENIDMPEEGPQEEEHTVSTAEEFLQAFNAPDIGAFGLAKDIAVDVDGLEVLRDIFVTCNDHTLTLSGKLNMRGWVLDIGDKPGGTNATVDVSGLKIAFSADAYPADSADILFIGLDTARITGEPEIGEGLTYEIPENGEHATVRIKVVEVTTPEMHEAKLQEDMTQYLSGVEYPGGLQINTEFMADEVLEVRLADPVIGREIGIKIDGGLTLILTGSVTFDGGFYCLELAPGSSGTAIVDVTGLEIKGTAALGDIKPAEIFLVRDTHVDFIFNEDDPHLKVVKNERY